MDYKTSGVDIIKGRTFVGWNPMCIPTMDSLVWTLKRREQIAKGEIIG